MKKNYILSGLLVAMLGLITINLKSQKSMESEGKCPFNHGEVKQEVKSAQAVSTNT